jgi:OHS family lactose permease-like MFS transporter
MKLKVNEEFHIQNNRGNSTMKKSSIYWKLSLYFFFFFFSYAACYSFFAIWLGEKLHLTGTQTGLIFSINAAFTMAFQPLYGYISDRIGLKKHLLYFISLLVLFSGPFYIFVYGPLLTMNFWAGALVGGFYLGLSFLAGCAAIESYIEKVGRKYSFEFGRARMWGSIGSASAAFFAGQVFNINPNINFWMASISAIVLVLIIVFTRVEMSGVEVERAESVKFKDVVQLFALKDFWFFMLYMLGATCIYSIYDQQFPIYYSSLFPTKALGNQIFGYLNSFQVFLEAGMMFFAPFIVNKIGAKKGLVLAGIIMTFRMIGSGLVHDPYSISFIKLIHSFEYATMLVSIFKYLADHFDTRLSSVLYLVGFQFATQIGTTFLSPVIGNMYDHYGFRPTYLFMGCIVLAFTIFAAFTLKNKKKGTSGNVGNPKIMQKDAV